MHDATRTVTIDGATERKLAELARSTHRSEDALVGYAIAAYVEQELETIRAIKEGIEDARAGRVVPHDEAVKRLKATVERASRQV